MRPRRPFRTPFQLGLLLAINPTVQVGITNKLSPFEAVTESLLSIMLRLLPERLVSSIYREPDEGYGLHVYVLLIRL